MLSAVWVVVFYYDFLIYPFERNLLLLQKMQWHASSFQQEETGAWTEEEAMKNTFEFNCFIIQGHTHKELAITYQLQICNTNKTTSTKGKILVFISSVFSSPSQQKHS